MQGVERLGRSSVQRDLSSDDGRAQGGGDGASVCRRRNSHLHLQRWERKVVAAAAGPKAVAVPFLLLRQALVRELLRERGCIAASR